MESASGRPVSLVDGAITLWGIVGDATLATAKDDVVGVLHVVWHGDKGCQSKDQDVGALPSKDIQALDGRTLMETNWRVGTRGRKGRDARRQCDYVVVEHKLLFSRMLLPQCVLDSSYDTNSRFLHGP